MNLLNLCYKYSMKVNDLVEHIIAVTSLLVKGGKSLKMVDDIFTSILFEALLDVLLSSVWITGPDIGPWSSIDILQTMSEQIFITNISPNELMI